MIKLVILKGIHEETMKTVTQKMVSYHGLTLTTETGLEIRVPSGQNLSQNTFHY